MPCCPSVFALVLVTLPQEETESTARWRAHYEAVERELSASSRAGLDDRQRVARERALLALATYRQRGDFTRQEAFPGALVPQFVDREGRRCAVAELLHASGRDDLVERVRRERNRAWVADLATDEELLSWLASNGLTLAEAARIQTPAEYRGPPDTAPPSQEPPASASSGDLTGKGGARSSSPSNPPPGPSGAAPAPGLAGTSGRSTESGVRALDAWWVWWEFNKLEFLDVRGLEQRLAGEGGHPPGEVASMTEPLRRTRVPFLIETLLDPDAEVRAAAALTLGRIGREEAVAPLTALLADPSQRVRQHALFGLGATGTSGGAEVLLALLEHGGRCAADGESVVPRAVPLAILALGVGRCTGMDPGVGAAVALLAPRVEETSRPGALWAACLFQRLAPAPALEALALALAGDRSQPVVVRAAALEALGASSDPAAMARLQDALFGRELELRRSAELALGRSPQPAATAALMTACELESEPLARGFTLLSLGMRGGARARDFLLAAFERGPLAAEPWAALALGIHARGSADPRIAAALLAAGPRLRNEDSRPAVLLALGLAHEVRAESRARAAVEHSESPRERGYAATALALLGGDANRAFLRARLERERSGFVRASIAQALATFGTATDVVPLFTALRGLADGGLQAVTAASLGQLGAVAALPGLDELARHEDDSALVRATAFGGLGVLLARGAPLVLPSISRGANFALYDDWVFELFFLAL
jgi:HEAT repeat protein